jgi:hypothetical protein
VATDPMKSCDDHGLAGRLALEAASRSEVEAVRAWLSAIRAGSSWLEPAKEGAGLTKGQLEIPEQGRDGMVRQGPYAQ